MKRSEKSSYFGLELEISLITFEKFSPIKRPSKYSTQLAPGVDDAGLRVFPSLYPNRRFEVKQLDRTFDRMIEELGVRNSF